MIVGEQPKRTNPTVQIPQWSFLEDSGMDVYSHSPGSGGSSGSVKCDGCSSGGGYSPYYLQEALAMLKRYLPSNEAEMDSDIDVSGKEIDSPLDAYSSDQFRMVLPQQSPRSTSSIPSYDGSPLRQAIEACAKQMPYLSSPGTSPPVSPRIESPPQSPIIKSLNRPHAPSSIKEMVASLRNLQLNKELCKLPSPSSSSSSWNVQVGSPVFGSPKESTTRPGLSTLPETSTPPGIRYLDFWDLGTGEEPAMERVESGRDLRAKMFEKLRKENSVGCGDQDKNSSGAGGLDVDWISELLQ
uniref:Uncharacterized protein n=1 Tax=Cucumis sativus TaxID=3659 RepID=A0A0A0LEW6_CUCSA